MTCALLLAVALSAAPSKLAVAPLAGQNVSDQTLEDLSRKLAAAFEREGFTVTSPQTAAAALGTDPGKFTDAQVPDLARSLAVELIAVGNIARVGKVHQVDIRVLNGTDAKVLATHSRKVRSLAGVNAELKRAARSLTAVVRPSEQAVTNVEAPEDDAPTNLRQYAWAPALGGIALAGAGTYFLLQTQDSADELRRRRMTEAQAQNVSRYGQQSESMTWGAFMLAGGAIGAAAAMYLLSDDDAEEEDDAAVTISVGASANGAFAGVRLDLP